MGICVSIVAPDDPGKERSDEIDRLLEEDAKRLKRECRMLVLGSPGSGKSTMMKQLKIMHGGFSETELSQYRQTIHGTILDSAGQVLEYMSREGLELVEYSKRALAGEILDYRSEDQNVVLSTKIVEAIHQVINDPSFAKVMYEYSGNFHLVDSASYFFGEASRIGAPGYLPNTTDVMKTKVKRMGLTEARFNVGSLPIHMLDVGGLRSERKKWIHYFESVTSVMFCVGLSEYDQDLLEDESQNRLHLSIDLFDSVVNSRWFMCTTVILLLNKLDLLRDMLPKVPLERYFPEYTDGNDLFKAARYIQSKFMQRNHAKLCIYPHLTQATDPTNIRLVFSAIKESMLQNMHNDSRIL